ncbi:MAG: hypothetical protein OEW08_05520 [Gammaproteobacteria bacterium]|nr:hypothetical protein [Gammaproteobacteria bacterium]
MNKYEKIVLWIVLSIILALQIIIVILVRRTPTGPPPAVVSSPVSLFGSPPPASAPPSLPAAPSTPLQKPELPDPLAKGALVLQGHCGQCHVVPAPKQHTAAQWSDVLRKKRKIMQPQPRVGLFGGGAQLPPPSAAEWHELEVYLRRHAAN